MILILGIVANGCISDGFTNSPSDILSFSTDTVSFDTVFTGVGTPTARLKVYNRAKKSVNISSISFSKDDGTFQMNVDGVSGKRFSDVEIRGGDSIFVFIECLIPEGSSATPSLVEDKVVFVTNGVSQDVLVEAWGQNVTRLKGVNIKEDMRLTADRPYIVFDSLTVEQGATLRIDPGVQLLFHDKASMRVRGKIEAIGEVGRMIDMRGDRLDNVLPNVGYDILAGQWKGITIEAESFDNRLEYVDMRSTEHGLVVDSCGNLERSKLLIVNSWLHNSQESALKSEYAKVDAYGSVFSESAGATVSLKGGSHEFVQCTLANYYLFSAISSPILSLYHCLPADKEEDPMNDNPLMRANFENGIIYGLAKDLNIGDFADSDVYMRNMLLKSNGEDDEHFIDCVWGEDPLFKTDRPSYYFNYRVQEDSPAIGAGNYGYVVPLCERDMDGNLRQNPPTLGAYCYVEEEKDK
ncbi:MAG: hypothetical protein K2N03_02455 [Muribaculaceae bacterium]|nr:hypothetical protein [Muribaculaceae bacterium]